MENQIESEVIIEAAFFNDKSFLNSLNEFDYDLLKLLVEQVRNNGISTTTIISKKKDPIGYFEIQFLPEFDFNGKVSNVLINTVPTTKAAYQKSISNSSSTIDPSDNTGFNALAVFNGDLKLQDYFSTCSVDFNEAISNPEGIFALNVWLKNLFNDSAESSLLLSKGQTGKMALNLTSLGLSKQTGLIGIKIECGEGNSSFDSVNDINGMDKSILDTIPAAIAVFDLNHRYLFVNKKACSNDKMRKWIIGKNDFEYCIYRNKPFDLAIKRRIAFNKLLISGKEVILDERLKTSEGTQHHLRIFQSLNNKEGQIQSILGYGVDITSVKNIEKNLDHMSLAVKEATEGIALLDNEGKYIYINNAHVKMFGYLNDKDFIGNSWHMLYEENEIERLESTIFPEIMKSGRWVGETKGKLITGNPVYQQVTLSRTSDGKLICICRDITEERRQKEKLKTATVIANNTSSVIILVDPKAKITWVNKAFIDVTEYTFKEVSGKDISMFYGSETDKKVVKKIFEHFKNKKRFSAEIVNYSKSGRKYWLQINMNPIYDVNGQLINFVVVQNDITQLKWAEDSAIKSLQKEKDLSELKSQFVSLASHEIRSPLACIQSSLDLIRIFLDSNKISNVRIEKHLDQIESQITRLSTIMTNLLSAGRLEIEDFNFQKTEVDIENFVKSVINDYFQINCDGRNINFIVKGEKHESHIDKVLFSQILVNLINNAMKYSLGTCNPDIILNYQAKHFTIQVKDQGIGIPEDQHKNIFTSFFRANNVENIQGTGLGLVIVKRFVEMHSGKISFISAQGKGSSFEIKFPYL